MLHQQVVVSLGELLSHSKHRSRHCLEELLPKLSHQQVVACLELNKPMQEDSLVVLELE